MPCFQSNKLRLFRVAAIQTAVHLARMAVFGAMVLQLGYFIVALAAFGYDAHANVHRKNPRQTSSLNIFLCGASPLTCSSMGMTGLPWTCLAIRLSRSLPLPRLHV